MAVTTLDAKTALVIIDLQNGIAAYPTVHPMAEVVKPATALAGAFRRKGLPVVLVNVAVDAMTDLSLDTHTHSITRIFPKLGETGTTTEIIGLLQERA